MRKYTVHTQFLVRDVNQKNLMILVPIPLNDSDSLTVPLKKKKISVFKEMFENI